MSTTFSEIYIVWEPRSIGDNFSMCLSAGSRQILPIHQIPLSYYPFKGNQFRSPHGSMKI